MVKLKIGGKVTGVVVGEFDGLLITAHPLKAKRGGRDRVWIQIRQGKASGKPWRVSASLSYARSADIQFEKD